MVKNSFYVFYNSALNIIFVRILLSKSYSDERANFSLSLDQRRNKIMEIVCAIVSRGKPK